MEVKAVLRQYAGPKVETRNRGLEYYLTSIEL